MVCRFAASMLALSAGLLVVPLRADDAVLKRYCSGCHNSKLKTGNFSLDGVKPDDSAAWEKVVRKLRTRSMPPAGLPRPDEATYRNVQSAIESRLDAQPPRPGRTGTFRRLNRTEYRNAIRDLLHLDVDVSSLLPADESSHGFDNITVGDLSPTLLERYLGAARRIARLAAGTPSRSPGGETWTLPPDLTQESHFEELPPGTRGGTVVRYNFPLDATYEVVVRLARDRNEHVEGLREPHEVEILLDGEPLQRFVVKPPAKGQDFSGVDRHLTVKIPVKAGPHKVAATFPHTADLLLERERQPWHASFNMDRHPRIRPAVYSVTVNGPYEAKGPGDPPWRSRLYVCNPTGPGDEACASRILSTVMRRAWRRPVRADEMQAQMRFFRQGAGEGKSFESGIEMALSSILLSPEFLFRVERDPAGLAPGTVYSISDLELASRLSFFLWSSIPDDALLEKAVAGTLRKPEVLEAEVRRMLRDERSRALVTNFAEQWLYLRNLSSANPDMRLFPDFDDNLRRSFRRETELLVENVLREDRSALELLTADYTFVNERLAKHYGIPGIYGSRFRRVPAGPGGLLRHGSVLTVTSYATRTSPVIRGKWVLDNILGVPPPPPPPDVPALKENAGSTKALSMRDRLAQHRANPACFGCHQLMDPVGFALEHFDAVGRPRAAEDGRAIDASGVLPDGAKFDGIAGLQKALLNRPEMFVTTLTEKLMTYALGRGVDHHDGPAVRRVVRESAKEDYRLSAVIAGIVRSAPFRMRSTP